MSSSEVYEGSVVHVSRRSERVAAAEHLLAAYHELATAGAHLGKVPADPDRPMRKEMQRIAADVLNAIGSLAPGLLEAIEADASGGTIPPVRDPFLAAAFDEIQAGARERLSQRYSATSERLKPEPSASTQAVYTQAEVDAMIAFVGRKVGQLRAGVDESDALAAAGERVGYESSYRVLRRAVAQMLEATGDVP